MFGSNRPNYSYETYAVRNFLLKSRISALPHLDVYSNTYSCVGGAPIKIGRAQECCEGYICEPGNVKVTCTKKENVAMEDLRVCAAEVNSNPLDRS